MGRWRNKGNYRRRNWTVEWTTFIPGQGHVFTQYVDGRAIWLAGVRVG